MYVLVTDVVGFISSHAVVELIEVRYQVVIIDNFRTSSPLMVSGIEKIIGK